MVMLEVCSVELWAGIVGRVTADIFERRLWSGSVVGIGIEDEGR